MSLITLADAKSWLRIPDADVSNDTSIQFVIDAAEGMIESRVGICTPKTYDRYITPTGSKIWLPKTPVLSVISVTESFGVYSWNLDYQDPGSGPIINGSGGEPSAPPAASIYAYSLDVPLIGEMTARTVANAVRPFYPLDHGVRVIWTAGRNPIPPALQLAGRELVAHIWQNAELRSVSQSATYTQYDATTGTMDVRDPSGVTQFWIGFPNRIIALLESEMTRLPIFA